MICCMNTVCIISVLPETSLVFSTTFSTEFLLQRGNNVIRCMSPSYKHSVSHFCSSGNLPGLFSTTFPTEFHLHCGVVVRVSNSGTQTVGLMKENLNSRHRAFHLIITVNANTEGGEHWEVNSAGQGGVGAGAWHTWSYQALWWRWWESGG